MTAFGWSMDYFTVVVYRCGKGDVPLYLTSHFTQIQYGYCIKQSLDYLYVPGLNTELFKQCLLYQSPI